MSTNDSDLVEDDSTSYSIKFNILISLEIPSILVSLVIFIHFGTSRAVRSADHQHSMFVLLAINFVQIITVLPIPIDFYRLGGIVRPATIAYCIWWRWYEFSIYNINNFLMTWISIERHLLIFHKHLIRGLGTWKRWSLHIAPIILCSIWPPLYYMVVIVISPMCTNAWSFDSLYCGLPCYFMTTWNSFDVLFNIVATTLTITIVNLALVVRVVYQRLSVRGRTQVNWRRQRKMVLQLVAISSIYIATWFPLAIMQLGQLYVDSMFMYEQTDIIYFFYYIQPLILLMVCFVSISGLLKRVKTIFLRCRHNSVISVDLIRT